MCVLGFFRRCPLSTLFVDLTLIFNFTHFLRSNTCDLSHQVWLNQLDNSYPAHLTSHKATILWPYQAFKLNVSQPISSLSLSLSLSRKSSQLIASWRHPLVKVYRTQRQVSRASHVSEDAIKFCALNEIRWHRMPWKDRQVLVYTALCVTLIAFYQALFCITPV